jgi:hypothetical protein
MSNKAEWWMVYVAVIGMVGSWIGAVISWLKSRSASKSAKEANLHLARIATAQEENVKKSIRLSVIEKPESENVRVSDEGKNWTLQYGCLQNTGETKIRLNHPRLVDDYGEQVKIVESGYKVVQKGEREDWPSIASQTSVTLNAEDKAQPDIKAWVGNPKVDEAMPNQITLRVAIPVSPTLDDGKKEIEIDYILNLREWDK